MALVELQVLLFERFVCLDDGSAGLTCPSPTESQSFTLRQPADWPCRAGRLGLCRRRGKAEKTYDQGNRTPCDGTLSLQCDPSQNHCRQGNGHLHGGQPLRFERFRHPKVQRIQSVYEYIDDDVASDAQRDREHAPFVTSQVLSCRIRHRIGAPIPRQHARVDTRRSGVICKPAPQGRVLR
jgi:hypothetical protein